MELKVAVEKNLISVKDYFVNQGCRVDTFADDQLDTINDAGDYDAIIISGGNQNFMGFEDTSTSSPIIDVGGMTPKEVFDRVKKYNTFQ